MIWIDVSLTFLLVVFYRWLNLSLAREISSCICWIGHLYGNQMYCIIWYNAIFPSHVSVRPFSLFIFDRKCPFCGYRRILVKITYGYKHSSGISFTSTIGAMKFLDLRNKVLLQVLQILWYSLHRCCHDFFAWTLYRGYSPIGQAHHTLSLQKTLDRSEIWTSFRTSTLK